jgi:hypothetical protein
MPNDPKEDEILLVTWYDLLEKELKSALDDLAKICKAKSPSEKRNIRHKCSGQLLAMLATT